MPALEEAKKASQSGAKKVHLLAYIVYATTLYLIYCDYIIYHADA